jgi:hypothetical protein
MKSRITFLSILSVSIAFVASAQNVEHDDLYFRSKDRVVLASSKPVKMFVPSEDMAVVSKINPTDSYSARNVNPEYLSQSKVNPTVTNQGSVAYFTPDYIPTSVNQNIYNNPGFSNFNGAMMNPFFGSGMGIGMGMMPGFGSPFNNFYSPWGYDPYGFNSFNNFGWSSGLSMGMGFGGWNPWGSPWNNFGMNNWGWNSGFNNWGWNSWNNGWNRPVVVVGNGNDSGSGSVYGKRTSRSNDLNNPVTINNRSTGGVVDTQGRSRGSSGRIASNENNTSGNYYQRGWRSNPDTNPTRTTWSSTGRSLNDGSGAINGRSNSSSSFFNDNGSRSSNWGGNNSSSSFSSGGGSRSSGGGSVGGSSGGARRGRD